MTSDLQKISINEFDYELPDDRIAKYPLQRRDSSKLLIYKNETITDKVFSSLPDCVPPGSLLVFNNTKVIQARMFFRKETGAQIEIFCLDPYLPGDYALNFQQTRKCSWHCLVGNLKKWKSGELTKSIALQDDIVVVKASRLGSDKDTHIVQFEWDNPKYTFSDILESGGELPIPPYLNRKTEERDKDTYQTLYSKIKGSVAAPTAGLHFTSEVFDGLKIKNIETDEVTLHVGAGTFRPVKSETIGEHEMHTEFITVTKATIQHILRHTNKPLVAVGTTSVRTLESLYYIGVLLHKDKNLTLRVNQWQPYESYNNKLTKEEALMAILKYLDDSRQDVLMADTQIMIVPGYKFKIVDAMITNFHQPKSTLLLLVSAFVGENWKAIYEHALNNNYRFLSYGDSSLLFKTAIN